MVDTTPIVIPVKCSECGHVNHHRMGPKYARDLVACFTAVLTGMTDCSHLITPEQRRKVRNG